MAWADVRARGFAGGGTLRSVTGTDPAANTEVAEAVPTGKIWKIITFSVVLVTDGNAANRAPQFIVDDGVTQLFTVANANAQTASTTYRYTLTDMINILSVSYAGTETSLYVPIPTDLVLGPGARIRTSTLNKQAGDNYGAPQIYVVEYAA